MMSVSFRAVASCTLCVLLQVAAYAQSPSGNTAPSGPVTFPSYLENVAIVENYLRQHPELTDLASLARMRPNPNDPNVKANADGTYSVTIVNWRGQTQTERNFGPETKMLQLAGSIQTASDRAAQLRNYTALYNKLPESFINGVTTAEGVASIRPIPPSELQDASLDEIVNALDSVASQWSTIISILPPSPVVTAVPCGSEVGAHNTLVETWYGDETLYQPGVPCSTNPDPNGLYANFDFANKGAVTCVKNQGLRGTCGVFAATSAVEELIAISTGVHWNLSEQHFWEQLTLLYTMPPQLYSDGYDAGYAISNAFPYKYQFAYENQWDYNPAWHRPQMCDPGLPPASCYTNTCAFYPSYPNEPACSDSSPEATSECPTITSTRRFPSAISERFPGPPPCTKFSPAIVGVEPYQLGPGTSTGPGQVIASPGSKSIVGSVANIWNPSGLVWNASCPSCPPVWGPGSGAHPDMSVNLMKLALAMNYAVMLGFETTDAFGNIDYVPYKTKDLDTDAGGHNIHVVGFVSNEDLLAKIPTAKAGVGGGYFILKNSWGPCSGDMGYLYAPVGYVTARAQAIYVVALP